MWETVKVFFKSKRILGRSLVTLVNWLTNTLVYYGISFNTGELAGDPYLNFTLSFLLELCAILVSHYTLDHFGRKKPYVINMAMSGISLLLVFLVPTSNSFKRKQYWRYFCLYIKLALEKKSTNYDYLTFITRFTIYRYNTCTDSKVWHLVYLQWNIYLHSRDVSDSHSKFFRLNLSSIRKARCRVSTKYTAFG